MATRRPPRTGKKTAKPTAESEVPRFERDVERLRAALGKRRTLALSAEEAKALAEQSEVDAANVVPLAAALEVADETKLPAAFLFDMFRESKAAPELLSAKGISSAVDAAVEKGALEPLSPEARAGVMEKIEALRPKEKFADLRFQTLSPNIAERDIEPLLPVLKRLGVTSPQELLEHGVVDDKALAKLPKESVARLREIEAHARLGLLETSAAARVSLLEEGFASPTAVANAPIATFRKKLAPLLGRAESDRIHLAANTQQAFLDNLATADRRNARAIKPLFINSSLDLDPDADLVDCHCDDCEAATSPLAYLADLLTYTRGRLSWGEDSPVTPKMLSDLLHQPYEDLPADCEATDDKVLQVRLCIESLRRLMGAHLRAAPDAASTLLPHSIAFAFAADVDGDRRDELVIGFDVDRGSWLAPREETGVGICVLKWDRQASAWRHLAPGDDPLAAAFYLPTGLSVTLAFAGTFRRDTTNVRRDRQQLAFMLNGAGLGTQPVMILEFDPMARRWSRITPALAGATPSVAPGGVFNANDRDFIIGYSVATATIKGGFADDVDGDQFDEFVAYGTTPDELNAFWVFKLQGNAWGAVGPAQPYDVAFVCDSAAAGVTYEIKVATAGDVNRDGRAEIIASPDAPGNLGKLAWIMRFDPVAGSWGHLIPGAGLLLNADADLAPAPWPTAHLLVADITGVGSAEIVYAPEVVLGPYPSDTNRFTPFTYTPGAGGFPDSFVELSAADASPNPDRAHIALAADIDGDSRNELIVFSRRNNAEAAWVMDRNAGGAWQHLSPIAGHPMNADLDWSPATANFPANIAFAADVDGDGQQEIVVAGNSSTQIWVLKYRTGPSRFEHMRSALPATSERHERAVYQAVLAELGTSYSEMRLARTATDTARRQLADRLAISQGERQGGAGDHLDQLLLDPADVTEEQLEALFGFMSTSRDPLSNVAVSGDAQNQTKHWRLDGAVWSADPLTTTIDSSGKLYARISLANTRVRVALYRDAARNFGVAEGEGPRSGTIRLSPINGSGLSGRVHVEYAADSNSIVLQALPEIACWQQQSLREQWDDEDVVTGAIPDRLPIIDPDVIGPDDFRVPLPTGQAAGAFDIWRARRAWVDQLFATLAGVGPEMDALFATMRAPAGAANPATLPWNTAPAVGTFPSLLDRLTNGDTAVMDTAQRTIQNDLNLPVDAFVCLMSLRARQQSGIEPLTDADWAEVRAILVLAHKNAVRDTWRLEERNAGIALDRDTFVGAPTTPVEGAWPPARVARVPLIEPELMTLADLPSSRVGLEASALHRRRVDALRANLDAIRARRSQGLEAALVEGFAARADGAAWIAWIVARVNELQGANAAAAETQIHTDLAGVVPSMVRRLAAMAATVSGGATLSDAEWADAEAIIAIGRKYRVLYPAWMAEEANPARLIPYWKARRAGLPRWLASTDARAAWEQALSASGRAPVVDPDLVDRSWLRKVGSRAHEIYHGRPIVGSQPGRRYLLTQREDALRALVTAAATPLEGLDAALIEALAPGSERTRIAADVSARRTATDLDRVLRETFGARTTDLVSLDADITAGGDRAANATNRILTELCFSSVGAFQRLMAAVNNPGATGPAEWQAIDDELANASLLSWVVHAFERALAAGVRVRVLLDQLDLTSSAWNRLRALRELAARGAPVLDDEWSDLIDILIRVYKLRRYARWRAEERGTGEQIPVRLGPDSFYVTGEGTTPSAWRVLPAEYRQWRDTLRARTAQNADVLHALKSSLQRVEERTLPGLRDRLISMLPVPRGSFAAACEWVEDFLLIDARAGGCQQTTRVAFAIDTLLALLWSVRSGQLAGTYPPLQLEAPDFDAEWLWIGSFAPWRSAMLVHLYPENVLHPGLKHDQSPGFREMIRSLRSGRRLTPAGARRVAGTYANYFRDVCTLDTQGMACVVAWTVFDPQLIIGTTRGEGTCEHRFAISGSTGRLYWSLAEYSRSLEVTPGFWKRLDQVTGRAMVLVGAAFYTTPEERWVYVFVRVDEDSGSALRACRYSLTRGQWEQDVIPLELPAGVTNFTAWVLPGFPPRIELVYSTERNGAIQETHVYRSLNAKGTSWDRNEFTPLVRDEWQMLGQPLAASAADTVKVLAGDFDGDGQDEIALLRSAAPLIALWKLDAATEVWRQLPAPAAGDPAIDPSGHACVGRFMADNAADSRDQIAGFLPGAGVVGGVEAALIAHRFDPMGNAWQLRGRGAGGAASSSPFLRFMVAGDLNGDGLSEVVAVYRNIAIPTGEPGSTGITPDTLTVLGWNGTAFVQTGSFRLSADRTAGYAQFAVAGDFDGDGRDEIAAVSGSVGEVWVFDFRANGQLRGQLGPVLESDIGTVLDFSTTDDPVTFINAFSGDFDGDGCDELALIPLIATPFRGSEIRIADFVPDPRDPDPGTAGSWARNFPSIDLSADNAPVLVGVAGDFDGDGFDEVLLLGPNRVWVRKYDLASRSWIALPDTLVSRVAFGACGNFFGPRSATLRRPRRGARGKRMRDQLALVPGTLVRTTPSRLDPGTIVGTASGTALVSAERLVSRERPPPCQHPEAVPLYNGSWALDDTADRSQRRAVTQTVLRDNAGKPKSVQACIWEAFYGLPLTLALSLQEGRDYLTALDWFRLVYDYSQPIPVRRLYAGLDDEGLLGLGYDRDVLSWVQDPLDPHAISATRPLTYVRGTVLFLVRCLLDFADAEFTVDTAESIERARILYRTALELLQLPEIAQRLGDCSELIGRIPISSADPLIARRVFGLERNLEQLGNRSTINAVSREIVDAFDGEGEPAAQIAAAEMVMARALSNVRAPRTVSSVVQASEAREQNRALARRTSTGLAKVLTSISTFISGASGVSRIFLARNRHEFCVGPNPLLEAFRLKAELNLKKIDTCRNVAGVRRSLEAYSGPTDQKSGLPTLGAGGQLAAGGAQPLLVPTPYRYSALIQRAKELVSHAEQVESLMLGALEKRDNEALTLLKTRQDIQVVRATVRAQELKVREAEDRVVLSALQEQRASIEEDHYQQLLDAGDTEQEMFRWLETAVQGQMAAAALNAMAGVAVLGTSTVNPMAAINALSSGAAAAANLAGMASTEAQIRQIQVGIERTRQEWRLRTRLAAQDRRIAAQNNEIETDHVRIAEQERVVVELQADNAEQLLDFHKNKFTSFELYDWMSDILSRSYNFFLQQATSVAQLAARQLAFERYDGPAPPIQPDYFTPPTEGLAAAEGAATDRRGLTGSARLLQDIYQLDQWALDTTKRKLHLTKTISLARLAPLDFELLRTTGVMTFATPSSLVDADFPGYYLRLIKRVSVSVIALVPPTEGMHATLTNTGVSRVVVGPDLFQPVVVYRPPESIALTSPVNATGVFTFDVQPELNNPFEWLGLDTTWELRMPRAGNRTDYRSLADVLLTIDYTALDSADYRQQVIRQLDRRFTGDRAFSLRNDFPDAWWDLHNPEQIARPFAVSFETSLNDFPPNLDDIRISQVALLFVTGGDIAPEAMPTEVKLVERGSTAALGGSVTPVARVVSTRRSNGGPLRPLIGKTPAGRWTLMLMDSDETREWVGGEALLDILLVVTYEAQTPAWPP